MKKGCFQVCILFKTEFDCISHKFILLHQFIPKIFFSPLDKPHCRACEVALSELENIDDDADAYGIHVVRICDMTVSKRYGIKTFPALIYFRNGDPLIYDGKFLNIFVDSKMYTNL